MKTLLRKSVGALILAGTIGFVAVNAYTTQTTVAKTYTVEFARSDRMADDADGTIAEVAAAAKANPAVTVRVVGHTETGGDVQANIELSERRADKVRQALISDGIEGTRILASGVGGNAPLPRQDGESDAAWLRRQARVEIKLEK
jgi:outer membrane protein OmpA-like peptidoglycan-associated protein